MSSLFDDSFLANLQAPRGHDEDPPPPPEDDHAPEPVPDDLFGGKFDVPYKKEPSGIGRALLTDPWGTSIELTEGFNQ